MDLYNQREISIDNGKCAEGKIYAGGNKYILYKIVSVIYSYFLAALH
jgi:hypothetical protein